MSKEFPYKLLDKDRIIQQMNHLCELGKPFVFVVDYKGLTGYVIPENLLDTEYIQFSFNGKCVEQKDGINIQPGKFFSWKILPIHFSEYLESYRFIIRQIQQGNSFLTNLTKPTPVNSNLSTSEIYHLASSRYKLWLKDQFLVLSPEIFVQIKEGVISSFPMKGTINADIPDASSIILNDKKEMAEHATIVDLIRNDLSMVADDVEVVRYRYLEKITTLQTNLLQVSTEIRGKVSAFYENKLGDLLFTLLPAGSVTGAPKPRTLEIIEKAEGYDRGFYTGICGRFDGKNLDSAVMIRFLEQTENGLLFKSGGGITSQSDPQKEYEELIQKVYVPVS